MKFRPPSSNKRAKNKWVDIPIFDDRKEFEDYFKDKGEPVPILRYWKDLFVKKDDWVLADDGGVTKVTFVGKAKRNSRVVQTVVGRFLTASPAYLRHIEAERLKAAPFFMDTDLSLHPDKFSFTGMPRISFNYKRFKETTLSYDDLRFVYLVSRGMSQLDAVKMVFPLLINYNKKLNILMHRKEVRAEMALEMEKVIKKLDIDFQYPFDKLKEIIEDEKVDPEIRRKAIMDFGYQVTSFKTERERVELIKAKSAKDDNEKRNLGGFQGIKKIAETKIEDIPEADVEEPDGKPNTESV